MTNVPPHLDLDPARTVPLIRDIARIDPARARRIVDHLIHAVNQATDGRYVAALDQLEAMTTHGLGLPRTPVTGVRLDR